MGTNRMNVGNVEIISLSDADLEFEPTAFFPGVPAEAWAPYDEFLGSDKKFRPNAGCFAVRSQGTTILVDTGVGDGLAALGGIKGRLMHELSNNGISLEEVSIVAFTHLHPDHVGWNISNTEGTLKPTFPNARYISPRVDWDYFTRADILEQFPHIKDTVIPLQEQGVLELIDANSTITNELSTIASPGHTPGHVCMLISSQGQRCLILGDVAHSPVQAHETDWNCGFDADKDQSRLTRHAIFDMLEQEGILAAAGHFPFPSFGHIMRGEGRRYWQKP